MSQGELSRVIVHAHAAEAASRSIPETNKYRGPHPLYLRAIELLADAYEEQGDRKALSYRCELCAHNETSLGTEHLFTLTATKKMASLLADGGELERARPLLEKAVGPHGQSVHLLELTPLRLAAAHAATHGSRGPPACSRLPSRTSKSILVVFDGALVLVQSHRFHCVPTTQVETCRCSRHMCMSLDAHAVYLDCSSLLAQAHVCGGRTAQATSLLVRNVASAIKARGPATPCTQAAQPIYLTLWRCSPPALHIQFEPYVLQVHGTQSAVTGKVMDALVSHGVSTYVHLMG